MIQFKKAERKKSKLRLAIAGPAGSGKTFGALLISFGIGGRVAMIDTENHSGELYSHLGDYYTAVIDPPFTPERYTEAIHEAERLGYDTIIIDSLSHAWAGQGGLLDIHGHIADKSTNSWAAWRQVTPRHNALVEAILQSKCHIIATMRSKMDYLQTEENGKKTIKKVGMNPVQRDGMEYEFTVFMDVSIDHIAQATKDRTSILDGQVFKITPETGKILLGWLESGAQLRQPQKPEDTWDIETLPPTPPPRQDYPGIIPDNSPESDWVPIDKAIQDQATQPQIKKIFATAKELGLSEGELQAILELETNKTSPQELTKQEGSKIIDLLLKLPKKRPQEPAGQIPASNGKRRLF